MTSDDETPLNYSPLVVKLDSDVELIKLSRQAQRHLGCVINEHVFLECPYAFVSRQGLLELAREKDSSLEHLNPKLLACAELKLILVGYASNKIEEEPGPFVICLTENATQKFVTRNRLITKNFLKLARNQIIKTPKLWQEKGSSAELDQTFLRPIRPFYEIDVALPIRELLQREQELEDRDSKCAKDSYAELIPLFEEFENIELKTYAQDCQTTLKFKDNEVQTYPGHPKNEWTQYEFEIPQEFLDVWASEEEEEEVEESGENSREHSKESSSDNKEEKEKTEEELQLEEKKREEWEKLNSFLKNNIDHMIDAVSFNASTNLYINDVADLSQDKSSLSSTSCKAYQEKISLIDLETIKDKHLFSFSWHGNIHHIIVSAYLDRDAESYSLITLWSLLKPLRPKIILKSEEKISTISFCPLETYTNVIIGGCLDGKIVVWEINENWLKDKEDNQDDLSLNDEPIIKEAKIAVSAEKSQELCITNIQWLPLWCHLEPDGNFQKATSNKDQKAYFATCSTDGSIFFWSLPRCLAAPAKVRSPLHLTIAPVYQLFIEEPGEKISQRVTLTCFCLPLARSEESSSFNIRDQSDLERLRRVFVGTATGEVMCCTWESQTFSLDVTDREVCKIRTKCCVHDGMVRTMVKSPYLDDVFITVGGRIFAIWKEDLEETPIFRRRSTDCTYGEGCWSGRSGMFILTRLDGCFEVWDLKKKSDEPILIQTVSGKITPYIQPSPPNSQDKLLAVLDGNSTLRIYLEPDEASRDDDLERCEWLEEFAWREARHKHDFRRWQNEYLTKHPVAIQRKQERERAEAERKHREARERFLKEQEIQARLEAERKFARRRRSKSEIWRENEQKRAEAIILKKKGFVPAELEAKRQPLVILEEERRVRALKIKAELAHADEMLNKYLTRLVPDVRRKSIQIENQDKDEDEELMIKKSSTELEEEYLKIKEELIIKLKEKPFEPKFDWNEAVKAGNKRAKSAEKQRT